MITSLLNTIKGLFMNAPTELPWITEGRKVYGLHEVNDKAKLSAWLRSDGKFLGDPQKLPWCGDFVETAIKNSLKTEPFKGALAQNPYYARNWAEFGVQTLPVYGAIVVFVREGGGHVGFLVGEDSTRWYVFGGNQGNTVSIVAMAKSRAIAFRWPSTFANPKQALPKMKPGDFPFSTNEA